MKLVMTLLARDEADIIEGQIRFHLAAGVDFFIVTDHGSRDGTTEILSRLAHEGVAHVIREDGATLRQSEWVTRMARLAALEHGADWVINSDADEFWLPSGGGLKQVLSLMPERIGVVETFVRPFLPHDGPEPFHQRMVFRLTARAAINDPSSPFRVNTRLLHRADGRVTVGTGNTSISGFRRPRLTGWAPVEVLHFPIRSFGHFERKFLAHFHTVEAKRRDHIRAHEAASAGRLAELYAEICVGDSRLAEGLRAGAVTLDTRLKAAFEALVAGSPPSFPGRSVDDRCGYAIDEAVHAEGQLVRLARRVDELERRLRARERARSLAGPA